MKSYRGVALSILAFMISVMLAACGGGGGSKPAPPPALTITSTVLPKGSVNVPYTLYIQASGGTGTYTFSITAGALPTGLSFTNSTGQISGTPTVEGVSSFTVQVTDSANATASANLSITIQGVLILTCDNCAPGTNELPYGNPGVTYSQTLSVTGGQAPYTWCVVESSGACDNGSQGALPPGLTITTNSSGQGVISGTPTTPGTPTQFTVQVRDSETIASSGSMALTLTIFDLGPKSLPNGQLNTPYNEAVTALGGIPPYTWTLTGSLPPGLNLATCIKTQSPACLISGTPTQVGTTSFTLTVTDGETAPASATATVSIIIGPLATNGTLTGQYAIAFNGFKSGNPFLMVGSIAADGNGNITSGEIDYNDGTGEPYQPSHCLGNPICPIAQVVQTGSTYNLTGGNQLGTMTLNTIDSSGNPHTYNFSISVSGSGCTAARLLSSCGSLIETDPQMYGSGVLKVQDPALFQINAFFPGNFALLANGVDAGGDRYAAAGAVGTNPGTLIDIDCNGNGWGLDACPLDTNDNGNNGSGTTVSDPFKGQFSSTMDSTTGRGTYVNLTYPNHTGAVCGVPSGTLCGYVYYVVNYAELIMMSTDPQQKSGAPFADLTLWQGYRQKSSARGWGLSSLNAGNIVSLTANDGGNADVTTGLFTADLAGNGTFTSDENDGGNLTNTSAAPGTYALGTSGNLTGQFILSGFPQFGTGGAVMYMWSGNGGNGGYIVGTDSKATAGTLQLQLPAPPGTGFSDSFVNGNYAGGTLWPMIAAVTNSVTYLHADGIGDATGTQNTSGSGGTGTNNLTLTYSVDGTGRGVVMNGSNQFGFLYIVSPNKFVMTPTGNNPALNIFITEQPD
jgi:Putative Ig domain